MNKNTLDSIDHIAIQVSHIADAVKWYQDKFNCEILYQDESWAIVAFENVKLAFVLPKQHPAHIAFKSKSAESYGNLTIHRDKVKSVYIEDNDGNAVEMLKDD